MKIIKLGPVYVGTLKVTGEVGGYYTYGESRTEVIDRLISLYWQSKTKI